MTIRFFYSPGACSLAVHTLLEELGRPFEPCAISFKTDENLTDAYRRIHPRGWVPAVLLDETPVTEAAALLTFLAEADPDRRFLPPPGSLRQAQTLEWVAWLSTSVHVTWQQTWRSDRFLADGANPADLQAEGKHKIHRFYSEIENRIAGPWVTGETITIADMYLFPFFRWGTLIGMDMASLHPRWAAWVRRMLARPAIVRAVEREGVRFEV